MSRKMLILDFDGVVTDTEPLNYAAWAAMFAQEMGITRPDDHTPLVGLTLNEIFLLWLPELPDVAEQERLLALKNGLFFDLVARGLEPLPGCVDLVRRAIAGGAYTAIVSRSRRVRLLRTLEAIRFPAIFDMVLGYEDGANLTTDRKNHARAAEIYGIDPADCVVIEDSVQGVRDALDCGIGRVIGYTSSLPADTLTGAGAHQVVADLNAVALW